MRTARNSPSLPVRFPHLTLPRGGHLLHGVRQAKCMDDVFAAQVTVAAGKGAILAGR